VKRGSVPVQNKIRELHRQLQEEGDKMMGGGGNPLNYTAAYQQMLSLAGFTAAQQAVNQSRNPYAQTAAAFAGLIMS
jgi:hypothetical protein